MRMLRYLRSFTRGSAPFVLALLAIAPVFGHGVDDGFDTPVGGEVRVVHVQRDGRILLGGIIGIRPSGPRGGLIRLNADGSADAAFNPFRQGYIWGLASQPDGKILVGGSFGSTNGRDYAGIARLNLDDSLDPTFEVQTTDYLARAFAVQPDGRIIVGGGFNHLSGQTRIGLARLHPDGRLDTNFVAHLSRIPDDVTPTVLSLALQPDGKILVGGFFGRVGGVIRTNLARLNPDGSVDPNFNPAPNWDVFGLAVLPDGKILVAGAMYRIAGQSRTNLVRLNPDGSLDAAFDPKPRAGRVEGYLQSMALQPDGKIVVGGIFQWRENPGPFPWLERPGYTNLMRFHADGSVDETFRANMGRYSQVASVALQPDGKVIAGGYFIDTGGFARTNLVRLNPDGSVDNTLESTPPTPPIANVVVAGMAVQPDGKAIVGGDFVQLAGQARTNLGRLKADGTLDTTFSARADDLVNTVLMQPDGKAVVGGSFRNVNGQSRSYLSRLNASGSLDTNFPAIVAFPESLTGLPDMHGLAAQADGKILVSGVFSRVNGEPRTNLARLNPDGTLDPTFVAGTEGGQQDLRSAVHSVAVQADSNIVVAGFFRFLAGQARTNLGRLHADGRLDETFAPVANDEVFALALQANGKILLGGNFTTVNGQPRSRIARLHPDGGLDAGFDPRAEMGDVRAVDAVHSLALQADGKIFVAGNFNRIGGGTRRHIARLHPDGTLDTAFELDANDVARAVALQADGKILVGGAFDLVNGEARSRLGRLANDTAALQNLSLNQSSGMLTWSRAGSAPEVEHVVFEQSLNGTNFAALGTGTRINGGWQLAGVSLPNGRIVYVRARGRTTGGLYNGSSGLVESTAQYFRTVAPRIARGNKSSPTAFQLTFANSNGLGFVVFATTNITTPAAAWENIGLPVPTGNGLYRFTDPAAGNFPQRFYQLRLP